MIFFIPCDCGDKRVISTEMTSTGLNSWSCGKCETRSTNERPIPDFSVYYHRGRE